MTHRGAFQPLTFCDSVTAVVTLHLLNVLCSSTT